MSRLIVTALTVALLAIPIVSTTATAARPRCGGLRATIVGTNGPNIIKGTPRRDVIVSRGGNDTIFGRGGNDVICTGGGADIAYGGGGSDRIFGGSGDDQLFGNGKYDYLNGGRHSDRCVKGGGGAKLVRCEKADLAVTVTSPGVGAAGSPIEFTITVKNNGPSDVSYNLKTANDNSDATCSGPDGGTFPRAVLAAGAERVETSNQTCDIEGASPDVTVSAEVIANGTDPVGGNNSDESTTNIVGP